MRHLLRKRYGRSIPAPNEKHTITGELRHVYATGGDVTIFENDNKVWKARIVSPRYWAAGSSAQAYKTALKVQKWEGRRVTAELEYHPAFGWAIFGGSKIRLAKGGV